MLLQVNSALSEALSNTLEENEAQWIQKIESLRTKLEHDTSEIIEESNSGSESRTSIIKDICKRDSKPAFWALILFKIIRKIQPINALELGTCLGISTGYQASALLLNGRGKIVSLEGSKKRVQIARQNMNDLNLSNIEIIPGLFVDTLDEALEKVTPLDYCFIDGHHQKEPTIQYFEKMLPYLSNESIVVFDDIVWTKGMKEAWEIIKRHERVKYSFNLRTIGIVIINNTTISKQHYKFTLF